MRAYPPSSVNPAPFWPLQDIRSHQSCLALVNHPGIAPPICIAHTIAIRLHDVCAVYEPPSAFLSYAIHHTIWATAISCKGQAPTLLHSTRPAPLRCICSGSSSEV